VLKGESFVIDEGAEGRMNAFKSGIGGDDSIGMSTGLSQ
jgi:hypothetical protein